MRDNSDKEFKPIDNAFTKEIRSDLEHNIDKFRDPVVIGEMVYRLLEERENTNRLLKTVIQKLEAIEAKMGPEAAAPAANAVAAALGEPLLAEIDEQIMKFVKESGKATAEEVRSRFNYKGKNAASARLNRLCDMGMLQKQQAGKKMFFFPMR
jgi:predicted HTH transcriptional regulator